MTTNGATGWGFIGEISSQRLRAYTAGFGAASTCVAGVIMNVLVPYMVNADEWDWGLKTGWFYAGLGLPFTIAMWFLIPETAGCVSRLVRETNWADVGTGDLRRSLMSFSRKRSGRGGSTRRRLLRSVWWR